MEQAAVQVRCTCVFFDGNVDRHYCNFRLSHKKVYNIMYIYTRRKYFTHRKYFYAESILLAHTRSRRKYFMHSFSLGSRYVIINKLPPIEYQSNRVAVYAKGSFKKYIIYDLRKYIFSMPFIFVVDFAYRIEYTKLPIMNIH